MNSTPHHYQIPAEPGRLRALGLAVLVHLLLLGFLWFGVSWQSDTPVAVEAEIWSPVAREAAPPPPPPPQPVPEPVPEPPKTAPVIPPPDVAPEPPKAKLPDPDIALEKEKKKKQEKEEAERLKKEKIAEQKAREEEEKRKQIAEKKAKEEEKRERLAEEKKQKEEAAAEEKRRKEETAAEEKRRKEETAAEEKKRKEEAVAEEKRLAEEQQRKQDEANAEQRARKRREEDMRRLLGGEGSAGDAQKSQGSAANASYLAKIGGLIKSNTNFVQRDYQGNPAVKFLIELQPDGQLRGEPRLLQSSGLPAFDSAVKRAIEKSAPFPKNPATGKVPDESIEITQRPKDTDNR